MSRRLTLAAMAAFALASPGTSMAVAPGAGNSGDAPGFAVADSHCFSTVHRQIDAGLIAGGGPKSIDVAPANCDHFWQAIGVIGGG